MLKINWDSVHELLGYYENDVEFLSYSDLLELNDKVTDIQDDIRKRLDSHEDKS